MTQKEVPMSSKHYFAEFNIEKKAVQQSVGSLKLI